MTSLIYARNIYKNKSAILEYIRVRINLSQLAVKQWDKRVMATRGESDYYKGLEPKTKLRYKEKIDLIFNCDPYTIKKDEMMTEIENFPSITISYPHIVNYFLFALSPLTKEELKAYKGLESYNQFVCGWVKEVLVKEFSNGKVLMTGRVSTYLAISLNF